MIIAFWILLSSQQDYLSNEVDMNQREIRAPAGVLRYGRNDPTMQQQINQQQSRQDDIDEADDFDVAPEKRRSMRLRFGRSYNPIGIKVCLIVINW